ncbi:hypothetical protein ACHHYP_12770 [Achlya hypogyna]|uniref:Lipoxygenase domain-containing protein n=1 Tax=Achlya hypogyna TaxID=1202772 RepID=A0A1V9YGJ6_ACHHY|nr:hypothetical protein ACHHYP_12770 [Achlya hypogyna]
MGSAASSSSTGEVPCLRRAVSLKKMIMFMKDPRTAMMDCRDHYGDFFLVESWLTDEKVMGFCGPEALRAFDAKVAEGLIVRGGSFAPGVLELLGDILPTIDGEAHATRRASIDTAFASEKIGMYKPKIREIVQREHASWAAHGGSISLAQNSRRMVFDVFLAVLFGIEGSFDEHRDLLDTFVSAIRKSARKADAAGLEARRRIVEDLVRPAIRDARGRASVGEAKPVAIDALIADGKLGDNELELELFHALFAGFSGVACLVVNSITAAIEWPEARARVFEARDAFFAKYPTEDDRWSAVELGYIDMYLLEVKRFYVAGPTQIYGRAKEEVALTTAEGTFTIPKGCLATAGLETTNKHPGVWADPHVFNPDRFAADKTAVAKDGTIDVTADEMAYKFCPHSIGSARRCLGEGLTSLVLQCAFVSLLDFVWQMVPDQSYALDEKSATPTPTGQLMAVGFRRRSPGTEHSVAGSEADWKFLRCPEAEALVGGATGDLFGDARLDLWTRLMIKIIGKKQATWNCPPVNSLLTVPKHQTTLPKITLIQTEIEIPTEDEDWPHQSWFEVQQSNFLRDHAPFIDDFVHKWLPGEDMERYVLSKVGHMWPRVNVHWNDRYSDRALELLAFNGLGQHLLQKLPEAHSDGSYYGIELDFMQVLEVRPGYAKYGASAYFNQKGKVTKIVRGGSTFVPGDAGWEYAKLCFRGSLQTKVTAVDHLLGIHVTVANYMVTSAREQLAPAHPLRRLLKPPRAFRPKGMLQRAYALTTDGMKQTWEYGLSHFKYETFPEHRARQNIDTTTLPFHEDGMDYWNIVRTFVNDYLDLYFKTDTDVTGDVHVNKFWSFLNDKLPFDMRPLTLENLKDFVAHGIFLVSSMHNHLGTIAEYVSDPAFCPSAWVEGELAGRPGTAVRLALIMTATGFTQPAITEDFSHIMLDDAAKAVCHSFTKAVTDQIAVVDARNASRVQPFQSFNPKTMEMAVTSYGDAHMDRMVMYLDADRGAMMDGDLFVLEKALATEKVVGFCGPEALKEFDAKVRDGSFVRQGALPPGLLELLGPVLPTLDGTAHARKKAAVVAALSSSQLNKYKPLIRSVVQDEHARWAAHGASMSLVAYTKQLVFKLALLVLLGLEDNYDHQREQLDTYMTALRNSTRRADPAGVTARAQLIAGLLNPALATAHDRVAAHAPKACVLDFLVGQGQLSDDDLRVELFHMLCMSLGGLECWATNCITAAASNPAVLKQLTAARDAFMTKHPTEDARWAHFQDLGYVNRYISEVKRVYVAGPSHLYARAAKTTDVHTSEGAFTVHAGVLVAAALDGTDKHPSVWPDPTKFNPDRFGAKVDMSYAFCPHAVGAVANRRCPGEELSTLVLQSFLVSLFDFMWKMVPTQDYTLDTTLVNPMPKGGLMVVGFHRRTDLSASMVEVAGSEADWHFLSLPEASVYRNSSETLHDVFADERLDVWTHLMLKLVAKKQSKWNRPFANSSITIPKYQKELPKITLFGLKIQVPTEDEDWPADPWVEVAMVKFLRDSCPFVDNFTDTWLPGEDMERYVMSKVGHMWPRVNVHWNDRYSDRAFELLGFHGLGQHMLTKLPAAHADGSYYTIGLDFMQVLEVRPGLAKYGADAFFDRNGKVTKIVRHGTTSRPGDDNWEYFKLCFRGSLQTKVTALDHLLGIHITVANQLVTSTREQLPPTHPLRRILKPFTFRSVIINYNASYALFWPKGMLHRAYSLNEKGMQQTWDFGLANFKYETFPEHKARQNIDTLTLPYHEDGMDYWTIVRKFVSNYLDLYYKCDESLTQDTAVQAFWSYLKSTLPTGAVRPLNRENLKDFVAHAIFLVSSMHNHLGTIAEYVSDPAFCPSSWVEGELAGRPGTGVRLALIMTATGFTQPAITEDFSHVMLDDAAKKIAKQFTADVTDFIAVVDKRNASRPQAYQSFNPKTMEMAVSI